MISPSLQANPSLDQWVRIDRAETVTLFTGKAELGQGLVSAIARIGAEELAVSLERVRVHTADTAVGPSEVFTAGSRSMRESGAALRQAAAQARAQLLALAAERLGERIELLAVEDGTIRSRATGRSTTYWELLGGARFDTLVTGEAQPQAASQHTIVGHEGQRVDMVGLVTGTTRFVHDLAPPGMVHARVVRPPSPAASLRSVDLAPAQALAGVLAVVRDGSFLGVVAEREEQALRARDALAARARWEEAETLPANGEMTSWLRGQEAQSLLVVDGLPGPGDVSPTDPPEDAAVTVAATYTRPLQMHASIGPSAALALWQQDELTIWTHSQGVAVLRESLAAVLGVEPERVRVVHVVGAGCYGHNGADDVALDAALLAAQVPGRPVSLKWQRQDEHAWEPYGPAMVIDARASLDAGGQLVDWSYDVRSTTHIARPLPAAGSSGLLAAWHLAQPWPRTVPKPNLTLPGGIHRNATPIYRVRRRRIVKHFIEQMPLRTSSLRALGAYANVFATESLLDELAGAAGVDALELRLAHLDDERAREVLATAAARGGWRERTTAEGRGVGLAFARYKNSDCYAAVLIELSVDDASSQIRLERAVIAADAGEVVDPDGLRNQLEGGLVQSASWTLKERVGFDATRVTSVDWESYPILTFSEVPEIETVLLDRPGEPALGAGEATQGPTAAAIANAVFAAVGLRLRDIPFTPARVREAALGEV